MQLRFSATPFRSLRSPRADSLRYSQLHARTMGDNCQYTNKKDFNFAPATGDEALVCGAARPGAKQQRCYTPDLRVPPEDVSEWVSAMKEAGVQRVVSMLSDSELATYAEPLPQAMQAAFGEGKYVNINAKAPGAPAEILSALKAAKEANEKVVVHCWGGGGRTGLVQAAWLMTDRGLSAEDAATAVTKYADSNGLSRRVDVEALKQFVADSGSKL